ncbi:MAG: hypothetical protein A2087_11950 [Spirochaetes bacterium GWD1_61_31]|nr:MAG: hypothetical protein A2Y37_07070 [Spirochaetes bacterium GWB1_60_80]OHD30833.1 MAG: hypothetical protein A2004_04595 [Spirochaetes bacterium GWC1_61_12]OHD37384.1 MAG: hypothetical protein A2087_11950 [Spirochaetes bacterium GWD1_61_31]OHD46333.1 MAG: hypothetical protein A2Y35_07345 [Spirochaetes bacterium GWE1_60_18]OHD60940.1 MAG: hypothetical protein A2Y32_12090 [Spirochaetes bacterium GWF1_60_12]HAP42802.1 hypothetical protein [Spirochaetaceae bacterium]
MRRFLACCLLLTCLSAFVAAQTERIRIVVFDLDSKSESVRADSAMLSEMLRNEFIKTGLFEVVSREQTTRIMQEAEFQAVGITSESDAIQIGRLLNVKRAIVGSVGILSGTIYVTIQLFDMEGGRFITAESINAGTMTEVVNRMPATVQLLAAASYRADGIEIATPGAATATATASQPVATAPASTTPPATTAPTATVAAQPQTAPPPAALPRGGPTALNIAGYASIAAGLGSVAFAYFVANDLAGTAYDEGLLAKAAYDAAGPGALFTDSWATFEDLRAELDLWLNIRLISYIAGGVLAAGGVVLAFLPATAPRPQNASLPRLLIAPGMLLVSIDL